MKCKFCDKEMTEKEYIVYLTKEVARLEQELAMSQLRKTTTLNPNPWGPSPFGPIYKGSASTVPWNETGMGDIKSWNIPTPTGNMCGTQCCMYTDDDGKCVICGKTAKEVYGPQNELKIPVVGIDIPHTTGVEELSAPMTSGTQNCYPSQKINT